MVKPFIRNHQYNFIKKQAFLLQQTISSVSDPKVVESVKTSAQFKLFESFPDATEHQKQLLEKITTLMTPLEFDQYLRTLAPYLIQFAPVSETQLKKLFSKNKKLKVPDLAAIDYRYVTYLGWNDIATNKRFIVYHLNEQLVGIEGRFTQANKKSVCFLCNRHEEVGLYTAITKSRPANASPDYYKAVGNYMCVNSDACNKNITDITALEKFIQEVEAIHTKE